MDLGGFEPPASSVRLKRAPNCATGPRSRKFILLAPLYNVKILGPPLLLVSDNVSVYRQGTYSLAEELKLGMIYIGKPPIQNPNKAEALILLSWKR